MRFVGGVGLARIARTQAVSCVGPSRAQLLPPHTVAHLG